MAPKVALFLALGLLLAAAAHGCNPYCSGPVVPTPPPPSQSYGSCPIDALKLKVCASVFGGLVHVALPDYKQQCCPLLERLVDVDAALCLCTAIRVSVLGNDLNVPLNLSLLLGQCGKTCPENFKCPST